LPENLSDAVPKFSPRRNVVIQGFDADEVELMLNAVDRDMPKGKRDYAIMMIAAKTGLRAVDIAQLTFQNINWRINEINLIQKKTGNPLSLPLMPEVGNAIASYILTARPKSPSENIFISTSNVLKPISRQTVCSLAYKYKKLAGINDSGGTNRAFHSFRRGFALSLLESSVNAPMIGEMLGDVNINSIKPYLAISETGLMDCGIKLSSFCGEAPRVEVEVASNA
jgi:integrase